MEHKTKLFEGAIDDLSRSNGWQGIYFGMEIYFFCLTGYAFAIGKIWQSVASYSLGLFVALFLGTALIKKGENNIKNG